MTHTSPYAGACILLTTKHAKSISIAPVFWEHLRASVMEYVAETDALGTFSGEVKRTQDALTCARTKCEWALSHLGEGVEFALASEGSFGPHPFMPFLSTHTEILYFIDRKRDFHLYVHETTQDTNFASKKVRTFIDLLSFADKVEFPSHSLILRPNILHDRVVIFKGIDEYGTLEQAFWECKDASEDGVVLVETDMRANQNPTRMAVLARLAQNLCTRLGRQCPSCHVPGWGTVAEETGLLCSSCHHPTELIKSVIQGCVTCTYTQEHPRPDGLKESAPMYCNVCNP